MWELAAALEGPDVDEPELVPRRHSLDLEQRFRVLDDTKRSTLFDRLLEKRCGFVWERVGPKCCVKRAAPEEKRVDLANELSKDALGGAFGGRR